MINQQAVLSHWLQGDADAIRFALILGDISQIWDDLIDKDNPVSSEDINRMMYRALVELHKNRFYLEHQMVLDVLIEQAIDTWHEANDLEASGELLLVAYTVRSALTPLLIRMTYLIGGRQWGREAARAIRHAVFDNQPFDEFIDEVSHVS